MATEIPDINTLFSNLRKTAKETCTCGNKDLVAYIFHNEACPFNELSKKMFSDYWKMVFVIEYSKGQTGFEF